MKTLIRFFSIIILFAGLFQLSSAGDFNPVISKENLKAVLPGLNTNGFHEIILPSYLTKAGDRLLTDLDTLNQYQKRSTGYAAYGYTQNNVTFPIVGSNTFYLFIGQKIDFSGNAMLKGILAAYAAKSINLNADSLAILVFNLDASGAPTGTNIIGQGFTLNDVDTNSLNPVFTPLMITNPVPVNQNFAVYLQTRRGGTEDDYNVIFSNLQGDGKGENRACLLTVQNSTLVSANLSVLPLDMGGGSRPDFDIMLIPIIDWDVNSAEESFTLNGFTFKGIFPNPASDFAGFNFSLDESSDIEISIIGLNGKIIKTHKCINIPAGDNKISISTNELPSGVYYLSVKTNKTKFAGKFLIKR